MSSPTSAVLRRSYPKVLTPRQRVELFECQPLIAKVVFTRVGYCFGTRDNDGEVKSFKTLGEAFDYFDETCDPDTGYIDGSRHELGTFSSITFSDGRFYLRTGCFVRGSIKKSEAITWVIGRTQDDVQEELRTTYSHINIGVGSENDAFAPDCPSQKYWKKLEQNINFAPKTQQTKEQRLRDLGHEEKAELEHLRKLAQFQGDILHELDPVPASQRYEEFFAPIELPEDITWEEVMGNTHALELAKELC
jgi:hypothetical protein